MSLRNKKKIIGFQGNITGFCREVPDKNSMITGASYHFQTKKKTSKKFIPVLTGILSTLDGLEARLEMEDYNRAIVDETNPSTKEVMINKHAQRRQK